MTGGSCRVRPVSKTRRPFSRPTAIATQPIGGARANAIWRDLSMDEREPTRPRHRSHSAVTSGRRLLIGGDPNSTWARRYRDLVTRHIGDMGGRDLLSEGELSLIRRASALECELEGMEARMSQGEQVNLELYGRLTDRLGRTLQRVGLKRRARDVGPSLADLTSSNLVGCCTGPSKPMTARPKKVGRIFGPRRWISAVPDWR